MKVINREEFLKMPEGTLYCPGGRWFFQPMCIKAQTLQDDEGKNIDWVFLDMNWSDGHDSGESFDILEKSLEEGTSFTSCASYGRDGGFDEKELFLIYERNDLEKLRGAIKDALATPVAPTLDKLTSEA